MKDHNNCEEEFSCCSWIKWVFGSFFLRLLGLNGIFLVSCIPVITIPAAMCGLHAGIQRLYRKNFAESGVTVFFKEFLAFFAKRTAIIWALVLMPFVCGVLTNALLPPTMWFSLSGLILVAVMLILSWFIPQLVLLELDTRQALKNAVALTFLENKCNFALILLHTVSMTVLLYGLPVTAFLLLFLPVLNVVISTGITMPVLQQKLITPTENRDTP